VIRDRGARVLYFGGTSPLAMALRTVFRSTELASNGGNRQALPMKIQNHHEFSKFDHLAAPSHQREEHRRSWWPPGLPDLVLEARHYENWGIFKCHFWGELIRR
jgi:hypothetical protein